MEFSAGGYIRVNWKAGALLQTIDSRNIGISVIVNYDIYTLYLKKTKLLGFSPQANYTDRATAACRRS
jgi:hypothetical protein